uniref:Uncharacterized protein n=1 Tax=Arundo donax TaxID=35708 RepID=A0A0A9DC47_ARUDO
MQYFPGKTMVTFILLATKAAAHSIPMYPPPMTIASPPGHDLIIRTNLSASLRLRR